MANLFIPQLPFPANTYDAKYFNETIKTLNLFFRLVQAAPPGYYISFNGVPVTPRTSINFTGAGVTVSDDGTTITIDIP